jgi:hypothetical protein
MMRTVTVVNVQIHTPEPVKVPEPARQTRRFSSCYVHILGARPGERIGIVKYGERGYYATNLDNSADSAATVHEVVNEYNARLGIPPEVCESMQYASLFGWDTLIAAAAHAYFKASK